MPDLIRHLSPYLFPHGRLTTKKKGRFANRPYNTTPA